MKVLHVITYDTGGAAKACIRLHNELLEQNIESKVLVLYKTKNIDELVDFRKESSGIKYLVNKIRNKIRNLRFGRVLRRVGPMNELVSYPDAIWRIHKHPDYATADIIHFHWVAGFLNWKSYFDNNSKPLIWTFHDHEPYTGGWHYSYGIDFERGQSLFDEQLRYKTRSVGDKPVSIVCPSQHLNNAFIKSRESSPFKSSRPKVIRNGLNQTEVKYIDQVYARDQLGIPKSKKIVLFLSEHLDYPRKGLKFLLQARKEAQMKELIVCLVGNTKEHDFTNDEGIIHIPATHSEESLNLIYAAADLYVHPTMDDISSNTIMEAQASGCPVVAFDTGGLRELAELTDGCLLTQERSHLALAQSIKVKLEMKTNRKALSKQAQQAFDITPVANEYLKLYEGLLSS